MLSNINRNIIKLLTVLSVSLLLNLQVPAANAAQQINSVLAIVNDEVITKVDLDKKYKILLSKIEDRSQLPPRSVLDSQVLEKLILEKLQLQLAQQRDVSVTEKDISDTIKNIAKQQGLSLEQLKEKVDLEGLSFADFRNNIREQLIISELQQREVGFDTNVSDSEVENFINSPTGQDLTGTEYRLGHILLPYNEDSSNNKNLETEAKELVEELRRGADFSKLAIKKSSGANALEGGDLGFRSINKIPTIFVQNVSGMQIGDIAGPIKSASGFHIIKLQQKRVGSEEVHQELQARQILIKLNDKTTDQIAQKKLSKIRSYLLAGKNFASLAQEYSDEMASNYKGGDLGWVDKDKVLPEFYAKISVLQDDEVSQPFKTKLGWHLVQITGKRTNNDSIVAAKNRARAILHERKFNERLELWVKQLRASARVKSYLSKKS